MERLSDIVIEAARANARRDSVAAVSALASDGALLEMVYDPQLRTTAFARWKDGSWSLIPELALPDGRKLHPLSPRNNLVEHGVIRLPESPSEYGSDEELAAAVRAFIHRYVNLSPRFERVATAYVLLSWIFDAFNELPYLRVRGSPGTGKTRFLLTVGSLCFKPIFASGASTVSPIFRILDLARGTLVLDESDFRFSDEKAELVKIMNNGNVRGFPVLRTEVVPGSKEFNPRAYHVFGPKLIATRGYFDDAALESRFISEDMDSLSLRDDIPISLPKEHEEQARMLRNQLLLFRFRNWERPRDLTSRIDRSWEPRLSQIFAPLLAVTEDAATQQDLRDLASSYGKDMQADRAFGLEADLLSLLLGLWGPGRPLPTVKALAAQLLEQSKGGSLPPTTKRLGWVLRKQLRLETVRARDGYVVLRPDDATLARLVKRFGLEDVSAS